MELSAVEVGHVMKNEYADFADHPRFGRAPRFSSVQLEPFGVGYRLTTYISRGLIAGTAIAADLERQSFSPVPVLYYFDLRRVCRDCRRHFIFFAVEQKHWYETLGFALDADCVRCFDCRRKRHVLRLHLKRFSKRYEQLSHIEDRSVAETLEMAECCLELLHAGAFHRRQTEHVRGLLNRIPEERSEEIDRRYHDIRQRLVMFEAGNPASDSRDRPGRRGSP